MCDSNLIVLCVTLRLAAKRGVTDNPARLVPVPAPYIGPEDDPMVKEQRLAIKRAIIIREGGDPSVLVRREHQATNCVRIALSQSSTSACVRWNSLQLLARGHSVPV